MAKIKLRLSAKSEDVDSNLENSVKEEPVPTTLKIKPLKKQTKSQKSANTSSLPKITLKTSSDPDHLPKIKIKGVDSNASAISDLPDVNIKMKTPKIRVKPVKLPGNGYDSEDPDKEDDPLIEEAIVIRFLPDESLDTVRAAVENSERTGDKNSERAGIDLSCISVTWVDKRRAIVRINSLLYAAKLVNLPTISEVHKTIDKKNIFKTVDVCQMLLVVKQISDESEVLSLKIDKEYGETYPDGLTPPLESVKDKFEKKYESEVIQNVEDEVARLLKLDAEAESSVFEFIDPDKENVTPMSVIETKLRKKLSKKEKKRRKREQERLREESQNTATSDITQKEETNNIDDEFGDLDDELDRLMGEEGTGDQSIAGEEEDDDDEEDDEEDEEEEDGVDEEGDVEMADANTAQEDDDDEEEEDDDDDDEDEDAIDDNLGDSNLSGDESAQHNALIMEEVSELESTIAQKEKDLKKAINPIMRNRILDVISRLQQELEMKRQLIVEQSNTENENTENNGEMEESNVMSNETGLNGSGGDVEMDEEREEDDKREVQQSNQYKENQDDDAEGAGREEEEDEDDDEYGDLF